MIINLWAIFSFKLLANILVAWHIAAAVHLSGSVIYNISSQFLKWGIILKAFGNLPLLYFDNTSLTPLYNS